MKDDIKAYLRNKLAQITAIAVSRQPQDQETARLVAECAVALTLNRVPEDDADRVGKTES